MTYWILWHTALLLAAVALMVWGLRAGRIGDHPHCIRCDFDLYGLGPTTERCPECGADLSPRGAVKIGKRCPRWELVMAGGVLAAISSTAIGIAIWGRWI